MNKRILATTILALAALSLLTRNTNAQPREVSSGAALATPPVVTPSPSAATPNPTPSPVATPAASPLPTPTPIGSDDDLHIGRFEALGTYDKHTRLSAAKENLTKFDELRGDAYFRLNNILGG